MQGAQAPCARARPPHPTPLPKAAHTVESTRPHPPATLTPSPIIAPKPGAAPLLRQACRRVPVALHAPTTQPLNVILQCHGNAHHTRSEKHCVLHSTKPRHSPLRPSQTRPLSVTLSSSPTRHVCHCDPSRTQHVLARRLVGKGACRGGSARAHAHVCPWRRLSCLTAGRAHGAARPARTRMRAGPGPPLAHTHARIAPRCTQCGQPHDNAHTAHMNSCAQLQMRTKHKTLRSLCA